MRDQKGFGECLEYRKNTKGVLQITPGYCGSVRTRKAKQRKKSAEKSREITLSFQGSCQEALMDAHAVSLGISNLIFGGAIYDNLFYDSLLTVMTMAILINV